mmetsp:Transcript_22083/g.47401  ORF Transcript_22083/g.47401 Transcript_22083/m.47401 type:complete len:297 (-) Transcript_22083:252-1142(-)
MHPMVLALHDLRRQFVHVLQFDLGLLQVIDPHLSVTILRVIHLPPLLHIEQRLPLVQVLPHFVSVHMSGAGVDSLHSVGRSHFHLDDQGHEVGLDAQPIPSPGGDFLRLLVRHYVILRHRVQRDRGLSVFLLPLIFECVFPDLFVVLLSQGRAGHGGVLGFAGVGPVDLEVSLNDPDRRVGTLNFWPVGNEARADGSTGRHLASHRFRIILGIIFAFVTWFPWNNICIPRYRTFKRYGSLGLAVIQCLNDEDAKCHDVLISQFFVDAFALFRGDCVSDGNVSRESAGQEVVEEEGW